MKTQYAILFMFDDDCIDAASIDTVFEANDLGAALAMYYRRLGELMADYAREFVDPEIAHDPDIVPSELQGRMAIRAHYLGCPRVLALVHTDSLIDWARRFTDKREG